MLDANGRVVGSAGCVIAPYPDPARLDTETSYADACSRQGGGAETLAQALRAVLAGTSQRESFESAGRENGQSLAIAIQALQPSGALVSIEEFGVARVTSAGDPIERAMEQLFVLLERLPMACLVTTGDFRIRHANQASEELFEYKREELLGREVFGMIVASEYADFVREIFKLLARGELSGPSFGENITKNGRRFLSEWTNTRLLDDAGNFLGLLSSCTDVTERTRMEQALEHSEQRYRSLIECLPDAILVTRGTTLKFVNPKAIELFQAQSATDLVGKTLRDVVHPDYHDVITLAGDLVRATLPRRIRIIGARNASIAVEVTTVPLADDPGAPGSLVVLRDVSERDAMERELRQKQKLEIVGQLAGGIAHDFNNVLTVVLSACSLLSRGRLEPKAHDEVELIRGAAESAASLTRQLLTFARRQNVEPRPFDLNELVASTERLLHRVLGEDVELVVSAKKPVWPVRADPRQIEQVILNLASNARAAMPRGGRLTLTTANVELGPQAARHELGETPGRYVELKVTDTGAGMDRETLSRIFEPFFTTKEAGVGLGLATCYGIVTQCGGQIRAQSTPGSGTVFSVYLPAAEAAELQDPGRVSTPRPNTGGELVLLVDDNAALRSVTSRILESAGYRVLKAASAGEALSTARAHQGKIDLLLTDVVMPGMSGAELAPLLSSERPELAIIYMSGYTDEQITRHGVSTPGVYFLQKPFTPLELLQHVRRVLDESSASRSQS